MRISEIHRDLKENGRIMSVRTQGVEKIFTIWFDYTKELMNQIKEGDLISVKTFYYNKEKKDIEKLAILRIYNIMPIHYAMSSDLSGYPAFVSESIKNAALDWDEQLDESIEDITKIVCDASLIGQNILIYPEMDKNNPEIASEFSFPMLGYPVYLLNNEIITRIYNLSLVNVNNQICLGSLVSKEDIKINIDVEKFIKTHFGIFGFTGSGKSNAIAHLSRKLLKESKSNLVLIVYDLLDEYLATMIDLLIDEEIDAYYVNIEVSTLPGAVYNYINSKDENKKEEDLRDAIEILTKTMTIPSTMQNYRMKYKTVIKKLLESKRIKIYAPEYFISARSFWRKYGSDLKTSSMTPTNKELIDKIANVFNELGNENLNISNIDSLISEIEKVKEQTRSSAVHERFDFVIRNLQIIKENLQNPNQPIESVKITPADITQLINKKKSKKVLFIINSQKPYEIRDFAHELSMQLYEIRRLNGIVEPLCLSIFDEADEFIPSQIDSGSKELSTEAVETLARRGRKYGLGVGIATQRITLLNTSIMAQPHTYFISQLPRIEDRKRITDAFALSKDIFSETFQFQKGQWLAVSYDALGLEGVPIPIQLENNEEYIKEFLDKE